MLSRTSPRQHLPLAAATIVVSMATAQAASAFCGFYVSGAGAELYNDATQVVMMRRGTRTVLSMQNSYQGPPENFAMVVPVPVVLHKEDVKTLPGDIFSKVDRLAAPRLVEYWEIDPCSPPVEMTLAPSGARLRGGVATGKGNLGVTIEAQFKVGEYDIVILSAKDSTGLDTWLRQENYKIPAGAAPYFRPYVDSGSKFFVAKVDTSKVTFKDGRAKLSPLRFHYDTNEFSLPVRLGLMNSQGTQDLIVHILADARYELANMENVTIPTNLEVTNATRKRFGEFYAALFDSTLEKNPNAVVTEYSWDSGTCDPCPTPPLSPSDLMTLGADVVQSGPSGGPTGRRFQPMGMVLTRLHARYGKELSQDLVFKEAKPIVGGREHVISEGKLEEGAKPGHVNNFQGRYIIRHRWEGELKCEKPTRNRWGGPWPGAKGSSEPKAATDLAFAPRGKTTLASFVTSDIPEIGFRPTPEDKAPADKAKATSDGKATPPQQKKKSGCQTASNTPPAWGLVLLGVIGLALRRRRRA